jgi:hypothetical protein
LLASNLNLWTYLWDKKIEGIIKISKLKKQEYFVKAIDVAQVI